ncbi:hypothetical protein ACFORH_43415 [Amycolatopsis roodepoortensis]|uniref:Uncharacterized protein n=1 Tax=Amycolatopsis roodepoortensis TaxID=700274 RepID=A0ABR9LJM7_9PSEU|nr:hypothetical protein [Amycolatopsis roodepoortensis]MBE1580408.1 hypothetical protein [Amycolatopsis roodepoortensis]
MAKTSSTVQARQVVRERIAARREAARKREQAELEWITSFEVARTRRQEVEADMAAAVVGLAGLGASVADIAEMIEETQAEVRRLRKLADDSPPTTSKDATKKSVTESSIPRQPGRR